MLFQNSSPHNGIKIVKNTDNILAKCIESVDYVNESLDSPHNAKLKTCNTMTLAKLSAQDTVFIQGLYAGRAVRTARDSMFWGMVRMAPTPAPRHRRTTRKRH